MKALVAALKMILLCVVFTAVGVILYFSFSAFHPSATLDSIAVDGEGESEKVIVIDPGHGGADSGARADDGTLEKDLNLALSKRLCAILAHSGYKVVMTREDDIMLGDGSPGKKKQADLYARLSAGGAYDNSLLVSIHMNKFSDPRCKGVQVWYSPADKRSKKYAESVRDTVKNILQPDNHRDCKGATSAIYILHNATYPALLIECGFMSNKEELEKLKTEEYQNDLAATIACAVMNGVENEA